MDRVAPLPWQQALWPRMAEWRQRMPHAILLHGSRGIGKRHLANVLAQSLLCETPTASGLACGTCAGCALVDSDNHPDFRLVVPGIDLPTRDDTSEDGDDPIETAAPASSKRGKPSREIKIDQVRELADFLTTTTHRGGLRVVVLVPAEALNASSANALLKMLEEPPASSVFLLVADDLDAVLPTIRSRCVLLRAPMPTPDAALRWLREQRVSDPEQRLAEAGGAPLSAAASAEADESGRHLAADLKEALLGLLARGGRLSPAEVVAAVPKDVPIADSIALFQRWGWDLLAESLGQGVRYHPNRLREVRAAGQFADPTALFAWLDTLTDVQAVSDHPLNGRLAVEGALFGYIDAMRPRR
ncbi:MAG: DNA polymerase III subunit delta' [Burkholderiaceae bacterium]